MRHIEKQETKMKMYVFEGTPEEIAKVASSMQPMTAMQTETPKKEQHGPAKGLPKVGEEIETYVTKDFAVEVLTRLALSEPLKGTLRALHKANGEWLTPEVLYEASGYSQSQFAGMMGAFGRRMTYTTDFDEKAYFFDYRWDEEKNWWDYSLPKSVISAIDEIGVNSL